MKKWEYVATFIDCQVDWITEIETESRDVLFGNPAHDGFCQVSYDPDKSGGEGGATLAFNIGVGGPVGKPEVQTWGDCEPHRGLIGFCKAFKLKIAKYEEVNGRWQKVEE